MTESPLDRVLRLSADHRLGARSWQRDRQRHGAQPPAGQMKLGTPYRCAWGNLSAGDIVEFGGELWKVIPDSAAKGSKPGPEKKPSGDIALAMPMPGQPQQPSQPKPPGQAGGAQDPNAMQPPPLTAQTRHLADYRDPSKEEKLTLPTAFVVNVVPLVP